MVRHSSTSACEVAILLMADQCRLIVAAGRATLLCEVTSRIGVGSHAELHGECPVWEVVDVDAALRPGETVARLNVWPIALTHY